jgi:hypothetical protein
MGCHGNRGTMDRFHRAWRKDEDYIITMATKVLRNRKLVIPLLRLWNVDRTSWLCSKQIFTNSRVADRSKMYQEWRNELNCQSIIKTCSDASFCFVTWSVLQHVFISVGLRLTQLMIRRVAGRWARWPETKNDIRLHKKSFTMNVNCCFEAISNKQKLPTYGVLVHSTLAIKIRHCADIL